MPITNNCVDVTFDSTISLSCGEEWNATGSLQWALYRSPYPGTEASGTIAANNNTWTGCFDEPFDCVELRVQLVPGLADFSLSDYFSVGFRVVWNGVEWVPAEPTALSTQEENSVLWIGNECYKDLFRGEICHYIYNTWLLDIELSTNGNASPEDCVYWTVYSDFLGSRSTILADQICQPNTTQRSLYCIENNGGCNEFGLHNDSPVASDPIIRVNGVAKTDRWNCSQGLCDGDIVTPLQGCSELSDGAIAGISVAAVVGATMLFLAAAWLIRRHRKQSSRESSREQPLDYNCG